MVYTPQLRRMDIDTRRLAAGNPGRLHAWWYDPRTGLAANLGSAANTGTCTIATPATGPDWVPVINWEDHGCGMPGAA